MSDVAGNAIRIVFAALVVAISCRCQVAADDHNTRISVGGKEVYVELAVTAEERAQGLQFRESLEENRGMLFVFGEKKPVVFWMKDTYIPLSLAFISEDGRITQIEEMEAGSLKHHASNADVKYTLEMTAGWFKLNGVGVGDMVSIPQLVDAHRDKGG
ncbi:MAG: DUF192 domain-containing protein [Planctomycetes bacterium]|nr:DUF192 domain-containing protein [Planctomycetota bacterium]